MRPLPPELTAVPFTRDRARALGVTDRQLDGRRFVRVYPRVHRAATHEMTHADWITAARLALPADAHLTGVSRLQHLGLDVGRLFPLHFVVERDLHLAFEHVFLHRTVALAPTDEVGVTPAAALLAYCAQARAIEAIAVGDWLLHHGHVTVRAVEELALAAPWRDGAAEALWVLPHLDARSRSLPESELRAVLGFAGLPEPEVNATVDVGEDVTLISDLVFRRWRTVVEYDGWHHQEERSTYTRDIDRYELLRASGHHYVQVTRERARQPRIVVGHVHRTLVRAGYDGPPPQLGTRWHLLFQRLSDIVGPRHHRLGGAAAA